MIITALFAVFAFLLLSFYVMLDKGHKVPGCVMIAFGMPWLIVVSAGVYWGFIVNPPYEWIRTPEGGYWAQWLVILVMLTVPLSYAVTYILAKTKCSKESYRAGWNDAAVNLSPHVISKDKMSAYALSSQGLKPGNKILFSNVGLYIVKEVVPMGSITMITIEKVLD